MYDDASLIALFKEAAWEIDHREFGDDVDLDTPIATLGIDSVALFEIFGYVEDELEVYLPDDQLGEVKTLRDLGALIRAAGE